MFNLPTFLKALVVLVVIGAILYGVTTFSGPLQEKTTSVLGVQISEKQKEPLQEKLQKEMTKSLEEVKEKGMELKVEDVVSFVSRTQKIITDYQHLQEEAQKQVSEFVKTQEKEQETEKNKDK